MYKDGFPNNPLKATALLRYFYKLSRHFGIILGDLLKSRKFTVSSVRRKTLHIPLGVFSRFSPDLRPIAEREIDYAFLGSVGFIQLSGTKKWIHRLLSPPKIQARRAMLGALQRLPEHYKGKMYITGDIVESIKNQDEYVETLSNTKISLCPRGTSYETFRFFESCKAGCIVICEPLPDVWFYKEHPGIVINDWSRLPEIIEHVLEDRALLTARSAETLAYWDKELYLSARSLFASPSSWKPRSRRDFRKNADRPHEYFLGEPRWKACLGQETKSPSARSGGLSHAVRPRVGTVPFSLPF